MPGLLSRAARFTWLLYVGIAGLAMLPGLLIGPSLDAAVFSTIGWRLASGDTLYVDIWDHKPPGVFVPSTVAHLLTHSPEWAWAAVWMLGVACAAATAVLIERLLRSRGIGRPAYVASGLATLALGSYVLTLGGGLGESFAVLPATFAVTALARASERRRHWLVAGLAVGVAGLISVQALTVVAPVAVMAASGPARLLVVRLWLVGVGAGLVVVPTAVFLVGRGSLSAAVDALFTYNTAYRGSVGGHGSTDGSFLLPWVVLVLLPLILLAGMALTTALRSSANRVLALASLAWLAAASAGIALQGRLYGHYALPLVVPLALLAGIGLRRMSMQLGRTRSGRIILALPLVAVTLISLLVGAAGAAMEQTWIRDSNRRTNEVSRAVQHVVSGGSAMLVWGNEPRLYELSDRAPALRYSYLYPLMTEGYASPALMSSLVAQLEASPPAVVVDAGSLAPGEPGMPPLLIDRPLATDGRDLDILDPLRAFVSARYEERDRSAGWVLYVLRAP